MEEEKADIKCPKCKTYKYPKDFLNEKNRTLKTCKECRNRAKKYRDNHKCEHGRQKSHCKECGGSTICEHNRERNKCKECGGASICEHGRQRNTCKICTDPIKITLTNWISASRQKDKKFNIYDANNFIDKCFLKGLMEDYPNCYYCNIHLQYVEYQDDLATIERIDNSIGHIKSNCVVACRSCNYSHIGQCSK